MGTSGQQLYPTTADASGDRRAVAIRILLALVEVDPTVSSAALILSDGSIARLDAAQLRRERTA